MEKFQPILLKQGATTIVEIDLSDFDMSGGSVVLTMRKCNKSKRVVRTWEFTESKVHEVIFEDEFTATLDTGKFNYEYDIMWHLDGERFAQCAPSVIEVMRTVGGWPHEPDNQG